MAKVHVLRIEDDPFPHLSLCSRERFCPECFGTTSEASWRYLEGTALAEFRNSPGVPHQRLCVQRNRSVAPHDVEILAPQLMSEASGVLRALEPQISIDLEKSTNPLKIAALPATTTDLQPPAYHHSYTTSDQRPAPPPTNPFE